MDMENIPSMGKLWFFMGFLYLNFMYETVIKY